MQAKLKRCLKSLFFSCHDPCLSLFFLLLHTLITLYINKGRNLCRKNERIYTSLNDKSGNSQREAKRKTCQWQKLSDVPWMPIWRGMTRRIALCHPHPKQGRAIHPLDKSQGLSGSLSVMATESCLIVSSAFPCRICRHLQEKQPFIGTEPPQSQLRRTSCRCQIQ
jgi:hypothetical protein